MSDPTQRPAAGTARRWLLAAAVVVLAFAGIAAIGAGILTPGAGSASEPAASRTPTAPDATSRASEVPGVGGGAALERPVAELADPAWIADTATAGGIPPRALAAYAGASLAVARSHPECGLGWNTLAAIGEVESHHGTIHGSSIGEDGVATPTILGIPLDGTQSLAIPDTDGGELDGDSTWDRAVGPMQFIPETWSRFAQDGSRSGSADVNNIDDAALTAAVYLCEAGGDLTVADNWITAVYAYNPSVEYNNLVAAQANRYAELG